MSVTLDTSHFLIGPCGRLKQSPFVGDNSRHASMALLSSSLYRGENPGVGHSDSAEFKSYWEWGQVKGNDDSVGIKVYVLFGTVRVGARLAIYIWERTTAGIR